MQAVTLVNGSYNQGLDALDRGFAYGDGVFETIAVRQGQVQLWQGHCQRLTKGLLRLGLAADAAAASGLVTRLISDIKAAYWLFEAADGVLKITLTRGVGGRGYAAPQVSQCTRVVTLTPWPSGREGLSIAGVNSRLCCHPWSLSSALAGLKHLNRLDQVMARNEWQDPHIHEGFMLDPEHNVISGVMSNVFIEQQGCLIVPQLDQCGIAGVMAQEVRVIAEQADINVKAGRINVAALLNADAVFMTNSLNGIWPVVNLRPSTSHTKPHSWFISDLTVSLQQSLATRLSQQPLVSELC
ncbi:MAG TPA: aminodeoxychorismate lyase [Oceanospirillaceae bacterium]|jgi:4-amino-4-deoxychorismate lyase|nr:aminodeoxychorismate lyase [Oceanospirillaceae bacterium]